MNEFDNFDGSFFEEYEEEQKMFEIENKEKENIKSMTDVELLAIKSKWTELDCIWAHYIDVTNKKIIIVKTKWLIQHLTNFDLDTNNFFLKDDKKDFGTVSSNNDRVSSILNNWRKGNALDPPLIKVEDQKLSIADGRHRLKTALLLQDELIPIIVDKNFEIKDF